MEKKKLVNILVKSDHGISTVPSPGWKYHVRVHEIRDPPSYCSLFSQEESVVPHGKLTHCYPEGHPAFFIIFKKSMPFSAYTERIV